MGTGRKLTERDLEVICTMRIDGLSIKACAERLGIAPETVVRATTTIMARWLQLRRAIAQAERLEDLADPQD